MEAENEKAPAWSPPYLAFKNFLALLDRLADGAMPPQIDRTFLTGSGSVKAQMLAALRAFDLIGKDGEIKPALAALARDRERRPQLMKALLERFYAEPVRLGSANATQLQLERAFEAYGISGETKRKAIAFYLKAAAYSRLQISPHFRTPATRTSGLRPRRRDRPATAPASPRGGGTGNENAGGAPTGKNLRERYIEMLLGRVAEAEGELDEKLLDRIERLLTEERGEAGGTP